MNIQCKFRYKHASNPSIFVTQHIPLKSYTWETVTKQEMQCLYILKYTIIV